MSFVPTTTFFKRAHSRASGFTSSSYAPGEHILLITNLAGRVANLVVSPDNGAAMPHGASDANLRRSLRFYHFAANDRSRDRVQMIAPLFLTLTPILKPLYLFTVEIGRVDVADKARNADSAYDSSRV